MPELGNRNGIKTSAEGCGHNLSPKPIEAEGGLAFLPSQALPRPFSNLYVNPNAVTYTPSALTPCIPDTVTNLNGFLSWVEEHIIAPYCDLETGDSCRIQVTRDDGTGTIKVFAEDIKQALIRCMGLTDANPHIVYNSTTGQLEAGKIDGSKPDCAAFVNLFETCPKEAEAGKKPDYVIGYFLNTTITPNRLEAQTYRAYFTKPTKLWAQFPFGDNDNNHANVASNQRLIIRNASVNRHENADDSGQFETSVTRYTVGREGWYRVTASVMLNHKYQALSGWIVAPMLGIRHDQFSFNLANPPVVEYRIDERTLYLDGAASDGQDITLSGSTLIYCGVNDVIQPRVWFSNTHVPGGQSRTMSMFINKSADTLFSICRIPEYDTRIIGR